MSFDAIRDLLGDPVWQMSGGERAALEGLLTTLEPGLAVEIGTAEGASLRRIARYSTEVHSFDLVEPQLDDLGDNVHIHTGDSTQTVPAVLAGFAEQGRNVDFALVDGDHSSEGVRRDVEALLASPAVGRTVIVAHDTANEQVRAGLDAVAYDAYPKVAHVDLDLVPGHLGRDRFGGELWYGLGLIVVEADRAAYGSAPAVQTDRQHAGRMLAIARDVLAGAIPSVPAPDPSPPAVAGRPVDDDLAQRRIADLEAAVAHQDSVIAALTGSLSWRVTRPLRALKSRARPR